MTELRIGVLVDSHEIPLWAYGYGMKINRIDKLTESEYEETCVDEILPQWDRNIIATHTYSWIERLTVIDAVLERPRWRT